MIIGYNFFNDEDLPVFNTKYAIVNFYKTDLTNGIYDEYLIDEDTSITNTTNKPEGWAFTTVLNALFQNSLEGGSVSANGYTIDTIQLQKRKSDELYWETVKFIPYESGEKYLYEALDRYVQNDFSYEYSIVPISNSIIGSRVISNVINVKFNGNFLTDIDNNYKLLYDFELGSIQHNTNSNVNELLNSPFPIVTYGNTNYRSSNISCYILTEGSLNGIIDTKNEMIQREKILNFLKNRKAKILRLSSGEIMMITVVDNPTEEPYNTIEGLSKINFSFVEVGNVDSKTLIENGLIDDNNSLNEVY